MKHGRRSLIWTLLIGAVSLAACNKAEPPPPPAAVEPPKAAAPAVNADVKRLAQEVYVYAFPLVLTDVTRQSQTAKAPLNAFQHRRVVPDASMTEVAVPNADALYSVAWLDLSKEPVVLSVPDSRGRYYLIALLDAWTNVATSLGKRTSGTGKGEFAIVGPAWKGTLPDGVAELKSPTTIAWLLGRVQAGGKADLATGLRLQEQFKLTPLSQLGKPGGKAKAAAAAAGAQQAVNPGIEPRDQVAQMDATTFLTRFAMLLPANPPAKGDTAMVEKLKQLGVVAGQPFEPGKFDPLAAQSVQDGVKSAKDAIALAAKGIGNADIRNGWTIDRGLGRWGIDYGKRAVIAWKGIGVNAPEDAVFMASRFDAAGRRLDGSNRYVLHFDRGAAPPADAFWSLSLYDDKQQFVDNPLNRHNIGSSDDLNRNADGSIDIYLQNADPGKDKAANWLPAPKGNFNLLLRVYWPKQDVIEGRWTPPGIRPAT